MIRLSISDPSRVEECQSWGEKCFLIMIPKIYFVGVWGIHPRFKDKIKWQSSPRRASTEFKPSHTSTDLKHLPKQSQSYWAKTADEHGPNEVGEDLILVMFSVGINAHERTFNQCNNKTVWHEKLHFKTYLHAYNLSIVLLGIYPLKISVHVRYKTCTGKYQNNIIPS